MIELKDNYQDEVLDSEKNQLRKYNMIQNDDGTVSFVDATVYSQNGDNFGAKDVNDIVARIGEVAIAKNNSFDNSISGMSANNVQGAIDELKGTIGYSRKNILNNKAVTQTKDGLTYTINADKSVTITGKLTSTFSFINLNYVSTDILSIPVGDFIVSSGVTNAMVRVEVLANEVQRVVTSDKEENFSIIDSDTSSWVRIAVYDTSELNVTVYPMIRYASIEDDTYEPYVADVETLINNLGTKLGRIRHLDLGRENTNVSQSPWLELKSQAWKFNEHDCIYMGSISQGSMYIYIGAMFWDTYGSFLIFNYDKALYQVNRYGDKWSYARINATWTDF